MAEFAHNLLTEPVLTVATNGASAVRRTLPEVLSDLANGVNFEFAALQPHQFHAWHAFLVQLGALAAFHAGVHNVKDLSQASQWATALRALTDDRDEPWCLIVSDLKTAAFMQPPIPEGSTAKWNRDNLAGTPDTLDLLATAKNHDVKMERIAKPHTEHWVYALVSLQTMQGFSGRENYGIARMNGGLSNRPAFAAAGDLAWPTRFVRDANLLFESRSAIAEAHSFDAETGRALLWLIPWNGDDQLRIDELDPFFIEICRRVRLFLSDGEIVGRWSTTKATRIAAKELKGNLGDPWVPIRVADGAALTATGLDYELVQRVLFDGEFRASAAGSPQPIDGNEPMLICQVLVRGQGKTEGYHERFIPIPPKARLRLATERGRRQIGELSKQRLEAIKEVTRRVLRPALAALLQGGPDQLDLRDERIEPFVEFYDREIDSVYFHELFEDLDLNTEESRIRWLNRLLDFALGALEKAKLSASVPSARVYRAHAAAGRRFFGAARRLRLAAGEKFELPGEIDESPST
ncbi:MAG TPA: hypothetical protein VMT61_05140 [Candidatus Binataceae bacterium]|nr:hypothetical protein [Candidatus Binataceae bacterium]